jgi:RimJ/RimL family protein N-acetyltransferase
MMELRDVSEDDLPILFEYHRDPEATLMAQFPAREWDAFMTHWRTNILGSRATTKKAIVIDGDVAGSIVSWDKAGMRLVGYWIGRAYWNRGLASAALARFVAEHVTARPLHAYVAVGNAGSIRVLEKCGFQRVGAPVRGDDGVEDILMRLGLAE